MSPDDFQRELANRAAELESSGQVAIEEGKLLQLLNERGYDYFMDLVFSEEGPFDDAQKTARSNVRVALSYTFGAKISITEQAFGFELMPEGAVEESSALAALESDQEKVIQLGLILQTMRRTPNPTTAEWKRVVSEAARGAVGSDVESWLKMIPRGQHRRRCAPEA